MIDTQAWIRRLLIPIALLAQSGLAGAQGTNVFPQGLDSPPYGPLKVGESKSIRVSCRDGQAQATPQVFYGVAALTSSTLVSGVDGQPGMHVTDIWFKGLSAGNFDYDVYCGKKVGGKLETILAGGVGIAVESPTPLQIQQRAMDAAALALQVAQARYSNSVMGCKVIVGCIPK